MTITADQEIAPSYDRESTIIAMVTARAWRDPGYKARVLRKPREVLAEEGLEFPPGIQVRAVADTADVTYIVLDRDLADAAEAAAFLTPRIQAPGTSGVRLAAPEIRLVQNTAGLRYIAIPAQGETGEMTDAVDGLLHRSDVLSATSAASLAISVVSANTLSVGLSTLL
jgi:hypothetical protein